MLALIAIICFILAVFGVAPGDLNMVALGLAFLAAHLLFGSRLPWGGGPQ